MSHEHPPMSRRPVKYVTTLHFDIEFDARNDRDAEEIRRLIVAQIRRDWRVKSFTDYSAVPASSCSDAA